MMYLIHHDLIDVVGGAFIASCLYLFEELCNGSVNATGDKYQRYVLESRRSLRTIGSRATKKKRPLPTDDNTAWAPFLSLLFRRCVFVSTYHRLMGANSIFGHYSTYHTVQASKFFLIISL